MYWKECTTNGTLPLDSLSTKLRCLVKWNNISVCAKQSYLQLFFWNQMERKPQNCSTERKMGVCFFFYFIFALLCSFISLILFAYTFIYFLFYSFLNLNSFLRFNCETSAEEMHSSRSSLSGAQNFQHSKVKRAKRNAIRV